MTIYMKTSFLGVAANVGVIVSTTFYVDVKEKSPLG